MIDLTGKVAIVTGGASGIGRGICLVLAGQGAAVTVADLNEEGAQSVAAEVSERGGEAIAVVVDVTDKASVAEMTNQVMERLGRVDITVNDAGVVGAPSWWQREKPSDDDWDAVVAVNLRGVVNVSESVAESMKERRYGKIVNIASVSARKGSLIISSYSASKAAVVSWTQSHALQLAPFDVNVNAICPGLLWTPMQDQLAHHKDLIGFMPSMKGATARERFEMEVESWIPMKKEQTPEDVARLAAFLASDDAHNITGQAINVDGGWFMN